MEKKQSTRKYNSCMEKVHINNYRSGGVLPYRRKQTAHDSRRTPRSGLYHYERQPHTN